VRFQILGAVSIKKTALWDMAPLVKYGAVYSRWSRPTFQRCRNPEGCHLHFISCYFFLLRHELQNNLTLFVTCRYCIQVLVWKSEGKTPLERPRHEREVNIKLYFKRNLADWINLAKDRYLIDWDGVRLTSQNCGHQRAYCSSLG
jgi:hypothetical protein